jgi:exopolysaccharide biosynthesis polyprenyl glycosylphosphotransferase
MRPSRILAVTDVGAVGIASVLYVRPSTLGVIYAATTVVVMWACGAYRPRIHYRVTSQLPALLGELTVATLILSVWPNPHRLSFLTNLPVTAIAVIVTRMATFALLRATRSHSRKSDGALIIGAEGRGSQVANALLHNRACGITPVGFVDCSDARPGSPLPVVADLAHLDQVIERLGVKHVIVVDPTDGDATVSTCLWHCQARDIEVWAVPALFAQGANPCAWATDDLWTIPFQHLRRPGQHTAARLVKRAFDFAVAGFMLVLTAPILAVVAVAVRLTSRGPIFFRQRRIGQNGREFELLKFRTMTVNGDSDTKWSVDNDRRMTPIGDFLRRTSIDELPQVFNVLRGDMSLVGPRPERPYFHASFSETVAQYPDRLRAPVGITGWAQIHGLRGDTSIAERIRFDNFYIEHWSLWLDVVIMVRTVSALLQCTFRTDVPPAGSAEARPEPVARPQLALPVRAGGNQA